MKGTWTDLNYLNWKDYVLPWHPSWHKYYKSELSYVTCMNYHKQYDWTFNSTWCSWFLVLVNCCSTSFHCGHCYHKCHHLNVHPISPQHEGPLLSLKCFMSLVQRRQKGYLLQANLLKTSIYYDKMVFLDTVKRDVVCVCFHNDKGARYLQDHLVLVLFICVF